MLVYFVVAFSSIWSKPVFVDIDIKTLNKITDDLKKITKRTKALMLINVLGISSNLFLIDKIAKEKLNCN